MKLTVDQARSVLGLPKAFDEDSLRVAYKKAALRWHPDKNPDARDAAEEKFKEVSAACECRDSCSERSRVRTDPIPNRHATVQGAVGRSC